MSAYEFSATSLNLLARVGQSGADGLLALAADGKTDDPKRRAAAVLAGMATAALYRIDTAEMQADGELTRMKSLADTESGTAAAGRRRNGDWLVQAAGSYATHTAAITAAAGDFHDAAYPLALLQGWTINPAG